MVKDKVFTGATGNIRISVKPYLSTMVTTSKKHIKDSERTDSVTSSSMDVNKLSDGDIYYEISDLTLFRK